MSVFTRLTDIVNANINALLEQADDPEKMVLLMVQEMEETLVDVRSASARQIAARKEISSRLDYFRSQAETWEEKAEYAMRKEREDLARGALREKASAAQMADRLSEDLVAVDESLAKLKADIAQLEAKLREVKVRQKALIMRGQAVSTRLRVRRQLAEQDVAGVMERFSAVERRMDEMEGTIESYDMGKHTLASEISALEADERVDRELQVLRDRVARDSTSADDNA